MIVYRLSRKKYADVLSGKGASKSENRWNSKGTEIVYSSESRALAMAEIAVHLSIGMLPTAFVMLEISIPDDVHIIPVNEKSLPAGWNNYPHSVSSQKIGDNFITSNASCVLKVPSAVVKGDYNYLMNPHHPDFSKIQIINLYDFPLDRRFFK